ncbi:ROK family transcriptional regulator [Consotaella salsifontis]|uniref:Sugar kinase of the NBD/HSP70 family, may contain an N-terminal HTH domain n=1 Tax=Consotaella salsifontis TaxID=1365950 RepID=A0A1T4QEU4_9HYPH|nr:ROK family transcriptional regulator [Consotaella salsifontis]SKA02323.1 Sugar kinase of the NBD/HSP70 family, may contain an N-terminal HTH domain [Consotaella salsifontis]
MDEEAKLSDVAQAVLASLLRSQEATRKMLSEDVGVSLPTVTAALGELVAGNLVRELRREQGARGRATIVYSASDEAGWVLGVDIGATQINFVARCLSGRLLMRDSRRHPGDPAAVGSVAGAFLSPALERFRDVLPLRAVSIALNRIVPRNMADDTDEEPPATTIVQQFANASGLGRGVPVLLENNVNCAAVAEHSNGLMQGYDDAAFMQIGVGIGLGFFCDGALIRGGHGASGELAQVPVSWSKDTPSPRDAIERLYGSVGLVERAAAEWPADEIPPRSSEELFSLGDAGHAVAHRLMREHAVALGRLAAAATTLLDPSVLVLGGGLCGHAGFSSMIIEEFHARNRRTIVKVSQKGATATIEGAVILAGDLAIRQLVHRHHRPLLMRPTVWQEAGEKDGRGRASSSGDGPTKSPNEP